MKYPRYKIYNGVFFAVVLTVMVAFACYKPVGFDRDSLQYEEIIQEVLNGGAGAEPGFNALILFASFFNVDILRFIFVFVAMVSIPLKISIIYKLSGYSLVPVIAYFCLYYPLHDLTQIRVGFASLFFLMALRNLVKDEAGWFIFKILIASLFHYSSLALLVLVFVCYRRGANYAIYFLFLTFSIMLSVFSIEIVSTFSMLVAYLPGFLSTKILRYLNLMTAVGMHSKIVVFDLYHVFQCLMAFSILLLRRKIVLTSLSEILLKVYILSLSFYFLFSFFPIMAIRVSEYMGIVIVFIFGIIENRVRPKLVIQLLIYVFLLLMGATYWYIKDDFFNYDVL